MKVLNIAQNYRIQALQDRKKSFCNKTFTPLSLKNSAVSTNPLLSYPASYYLSFEARTDKSLEAFYARNKDIMPVTVRRYIDSLPLDERKAITPLSAQYGAYEELILAENTDEVKELYPDESLFADLREVSETKAKTGFLYEARIMEPDLEAEGSGILQSGEDLTVYLLKKVFLENKTKDQINEDLDKDLNPVFKNEDKKYITYEVLSSLGIRQNPEYKRSLESTREGYSDKMGAKVAQGLREYWDNLSAEERLEKSKKALLSLENWWNSLPHEEKLAMLEAQDSKIKLLRAYKKSDKETNKKHEAVQNRQDTVDVPVLPLEDSSDKPIKSVCNKKNGGTKLKTSLDKDSLYLEWARKNLEIFEAGLSDNEKEALNKKRIHGQIARWQNLSAEEKSALIEKMQSGSERQRLAMIDAWNKCPEIREHMSEFMRENNFHNPNGLFYREGNFSEFQKKIMTAFWQKYSEDGIKLGDEIKKSYKKLNDSFDGMDFDNLKTEILDRRANIKKQTAEKRAHRGKKSADTRLCGVLDDKKAREKKEIDIKAAGAGLDRIFNNYYKHYSFLPKAFLDEYTGYIRENLKDEHALNLLCNMVENPFQITMKDGQYISKQISKVAAEDELFRCNRAMEQALADVLYEASEAYTGAEKFFGLRYEELAAIAKELNTRPCGEHPIEISDGSYVLIKNKPDFSKLEQLYHKYNKPIGSHQAYQTIETQFLKAEVQLHSSVDVQLKMIDALDDFMKKYGASAECMLQYDIFRRKIIAEKFVDLFHQEKAYSDALKTS